jgi:hypothetical protein
MAVSVEVTYVRRTSGDVLSYGLTRNNSARRLALFRAPGISAAAVQDDRKFLQAILLGLHATGNRPEARTLLRFGDRDPASEAILRPATIAALRLPKAQRGPHWKNSTEFILNRPGQGQVHVIHTAGALVVARQTLEEIFCKPSLSVQMNSALNACFRNICDYIKCTKTNIDCTQEVQQVRAFCFAQG